MLLINGEAEAGGFLQVPVLHAVACLAHPPEKKKCCPVVFMSKNDHEQKWKHTDHLLSLATCKRHDFLMTMTEMLTLWGFQLTSEMICVKNIEGFSAFLTQTKINHWFPCVSSLSTLQIPRWRCILPKPLKPGLPSKSPNTLCVLMYLWHVSTVMCRNA